MLFQSVFSSHMHSSLTMLSLQTCGRCVLAYSTNLSQNNTELLPRYRSINALRVRTSCTSELCGDGLPSSYLGGTSVSGRRGEKCNCSAFLADEHHARACRIGHHCPSCFGELLWLLFTGNTSTIIFDSEDVGREVLRVCLSIYPDEPWC